MPATVVRRGSGHWVGISEEVDKPRVVLAGVTRGIIRELTLTLNELNNGPDARISERCIME